MDRYRLRLALREHTTISPVSSGKISDAYCDSVAALAGHSGRMIHEYIADEISRLAWGPDGPTIMAGIAFGGALIVAACGILSSGVSPVYVRYEEVAGNLVVLSYRRWSVIGIVSGKRVVVVDGVATTGRSLLGAIGAVRNAGGSVDTAYVVVDREEGAKEALAGSGVKLERLTTLREILDGGP